MNKKPWEELPGVWKTESAFLAWIRGGIRQALWNRHPVKLEFIKRNRIRIPNPNPKGKAAFVWGGVCAITGEVLPAKDLQVDHKEGNHSLRKIEDLQKFAEGIILVGIDDLQFISKKAHEVKSYAEKYGISFEDALIEKEIIDLQKQKKDKDFLLSAGLTPESNASKRKQQLRAYLTNKRNQNESTL